MHEISLVLFLIIREILEEEKKIGTLDYDITNLSSKESIENEKVEILKEQIQSDKKELGKRCRHDQ